MENKEITIQRAWLENLLKYAKRTELRTMADKDNLPLQINYELPELLGYISSSEVFLEENKPN